MVFLCFLKKYAVHIFTEAFEPFLYNSNMNYMSSKMIIHFSNIITNHLLCRVKKNYSKSTECTLIEKLSTLVDVQCIIAI